MALNSSLYELSIMHSRTRPRRHNFTHKTFMFYLDLDEIGLLSQYAYLFSHNKANVYEFRDDDHLKADGLDIKAKLFGFLIDEGVNQEISKVMLLTNLRTFGYIFNPVSFYFCFDKSGLPVCVVPEIGNTFGEIKPFFIGPENFENGVFVCQREKYFYISPFIDLDIPMDLKIAVPSNILDIKIDDYDKDGKFLYTSMSGQRLALNNRTLWKVTLKYPFITLKVIALIHIHALMLWLKRVPYREKTSNPQLQKEVYRVWSKGDKTVQSS